ncbi:sodium/proline symporter, partial [Bacteriovoracaceae bacterium]|nr:sodium/proline symporter [Bacteriovoracaceae bacterium]
LLAWYAHVPMLLRKESENRGALTFPSFLGDINNKRSSVVTILAGVIAFVFLGSYAAAQFAAGGKSLQVLLGWDYQTGTLVSAGMIFFYCYAGGIRASIWTDVAQSIIMIVGMYALATTTIYHVGGFPALYSSLEAIDPTLVSIIPSTAKWGFTVLFLSLIVSGFGVIGQPHIMIRSMTLNKPQNMKLVRRIYLFLGYSISFAGAFVGLAARALYPLREGFDSEQIMPTIAAEYFHPVAAGLLLAALFAATISTADSQILVCSSALTNDIFPRFKNHFKMMKFATFISIVFVLIISLYFKNVFVLVMFSWAVLSSAFGPLLFVQAKKMPISVGISIVMILSGLILGIFWRLQGWNKGAYEALPGFLLCGIMYSLWRLLRKKY